MPSLVFPSTLNWLCRTDIQDSKGKRREVYIFFSVIDRPNQKGISAKAPCSLRYGIFWSMDGQPDKGIAAAPKPDADK